MVTSSGIWLSSDVTPIQAQHVEHVETDGHLAKEIRARRAAVLWPAALQPAKRWDARLVKGHDFAVEHHAAVARLRKCGGDLGKGPSDVCTVAAQQRNDAIV